MFRKLIPLLPALALCLPAMADMPAGLSLGEKEKEVLQKVASSDDFTPLSDKAKRKLEGNYCLSGKIAGQQWLAHFVFDRRSKMLTQLLFVSDQAMQPNQYDKLLKPFYLFTAEHLRAHFKLKEPLNLPEFGHASALKDEEMFPLHAFPGEGITLTAGLWKAKNGGIHLCFTVQPSSNSAMGQTYTSNTTGKRSDWEDVPDFTTTDEGKAFMERTGIARSTTTLEDKEEEESYDDLEEEETEGTETAPAAPAGPALASKDLPQKEQDMLNALILLQDGSRQKEGLALLVTAAQADNARALYELGRGYEEGKYGLMPDKKNAQNAFHKAAMGGFALAMVHYGAEFPVALAALNMRATDGERMVKVAEEAKEYSLTQRFNYAIMLRYGYGVRKDVEKAGEIMQQLATHGDPVAAKLVEEWSN